MTDMSKIYGITVSSPIGTFHPGSTKESPLPDGRTEIRVGADPATRVVRVSTDDPKIMEDHARTHLRMATNFLAAAEVLRQAEDRKKNEAQTKARRRVLDEFGYSGDFAGYSTGVQKLVDTLIQTRNELEEKPTEPEDSGKANTIDFSKTLLSDGEYYAYSRRVYGDNPPPYGIHPVIVKQGRVLSPMTRSDLTSNFRTGDHWVLLAKK